MPAGAQTAHAAGGIRLPRTARLAESVDSRGARLLAEEFKRTVVLAADAFPRPAVQFGSTVAFRDLSTGRARTAEVVTPDRADIDADRLSAPRPSARR